LWSKKFFASAFFLVFVVTSHVALADDALRHGQGLLWQVQLGDGPPSHVFGSVHSTDKRVHDLPPDVARAFDGSRIAAFELLAGPEVNQRMAQAMFYTGSRTMDELVGERLFGASAEVAAEYGIPRATLKRFKPWAATVLFSAPPTELARQNNGKKILDEFLQREAKGQGKRLEALETIPEQIGLFDELSDADQVAMLRAAVDEHAEVEAHFATLLKHYLARDTGTIYAMMLERMAPLDPALVDLFLERFVDARNERMTERMQGLLEEGGAFIVVGALHLPGDRGILHLLEQRGYRVTAVY
jgi:uncharacterized protein YbaP (TraB family)